MSTSSRERKRAAQQRAQGLQSRREYVAALEEEKRGYQVRGLKDRVKAVDAEIVKAREGLDDDEQQDPPQEPTPPAPPAGNGSAKGALDEFDPAKHNVDDVIAYLEREDVDEAEVQRVQAAESEGKKRSTITEWKPKPADPAD